MTKVNKFKKEIDLINFIKEEAQSSLFAELCALVGKDENDNFVYQKMQNRSKDPASYFLIDPYDYLQFITKNKCLLIFHSHLLGDEKPSSFDICTSENCCFPFLIYSINSEKFSFYEPQYKDYDVKSLEGIRQLL